MSATDEEIARHILSLCEARGPDRTICPSEAARALVPGDWRPLMPRIREIAARLAHEGKLEVRQSGAPVDASTARGPIRLALPRNRKD